MKQKLSFTLNGKAVTTDIHPMTRLLDVLRHELQLTGTKEGCGEGECGACSILVNGLIVNSCLIPAAQAQDTEVQTIEGLTSNPSEDVHSLHPVQKSFLENGGAQCGICTPGMVLASIALLKKHPDPTDAQIREGLAGNLCRCTGYMKIFDSIKNLGHNSEPASS